MTKQATKSRQTTAKTRAKKRMKHRPLTPEERIDLLKPQDLQQFSLLQLLDCYFMVYSRYDLNKDDSAAQLNEIEPGWRELSVEEMNEERIRNWVEKAKEKYGPKCDVMQMIVSLAWFADQAFDHNFGAEETEPSTASN